jgi:hypothetical protein
MARMGSPVQWRVPCTVKPCARHSLVQAFSHEVQVPSPGCFMEGLFHFLCLTLNWNDMPQSVLYVSFAFLHSIPGEGYLYMTEEVSQFFSSHNAMIIESTGLVPESYI